MAESSEFASTVTRCVCELPRPSSSSDIVNETLGGPPSMTGIGGCQFIMKQRYNVGVKETGTCVRNS